MNALNVYKSQLEEENDPNQMFNFDQPNIHYPSNLPNKTEMGNMDQSQLNPQSSGSGGKPLTSIFNKITNKQDKSRSKSPFKILNKISREPSPVQNTKGANTKTSANKAANNANNAKFSRSSEFGMKTPSATTTSPTSKSLLPPVQPQSQQRNNQNFDDNVGGAFSETDSSSPLLEADDLELKAIIDYVDEYYYGVRIFPGQDLYKVYIGWATSRFHLLTGKPDNSFSNDLVSRCSLINTSSDGSILSNLTRQDCYVVSAVELNKNFQDTEMGSSKRISNSLLLGCLADLSTGTLSFTVNGKESQHKFQVEPGTKLYPVIFVEPTTKEILQFELGRVKNCLPLSAALFPSLGKHVSPKCPPRLKLQFLNAIRWSRVPNHNLKVHTLKMNNILGWSLLCEENVHTMALYVPEKDRWISILELNENEKLLKFFNSMLNLYEAVCAQSNNYVAHQVCKLIDEKQLMYCVQNQCK
jgi:ryanodine receptor 2